jgi:hypothetical protein
VTSDTTVMFVESIQHSHPDITEQSAAQLRVFLVTAQQRQQSDSQALSMGLQALKQEVLDEGYDWSELITMLVDLVCADMKEDQHERFVAELDRLYASNASLLKVGSVIASNYPSALEELKLLVQGAQKEHEALAGVAGGTSKSVFRTWKRNPNRTRKEKGEAIAIDALEVVVGGALLGGIGCGTYWLATRGRGDKVLNEKPLDRYSYFERAHETAEDFNIKHITGHTKFTDNREADLEEYRIQFINDCKSFDFRSYAKAQLAERPGKTDKLKRDRAREIMSNPDPQSDFEKRLYIISNNPQSRLGSDPKKRLAQIVEDPNFNYYFESEQTARLYNEYLTCGDLKEFTDARKGSERFLQNFQEHEWDWHNKRFHDESEYDGPANSFLEKEEELRKIGALQTMTQDPEALEEAHRYMTFQQMLQDPEAEASFISEHSHEDNNSQGSHGEADSSDKIDLDLQHVELDDVDGRKLLREGKADTRVVNESLDQSDTDFFRQLRDEIGGDERLMAKGIRVGPDGRSLKEELASGAKSELEQGEREAEQEFETDTRIAKKDFEANIMAKGQELDDVLIDI